MERLLKSEASFRAAPLLSSRFLVKTVMDSPE
jgi:hypothetical protein